MTDRRSNRKKTLKGCRGGEGNGGESGGNERGNVDEMYRYNRGEVDDEITEEVAHNEKKGSGEGESTADEDLSPQSRKRAVQARKRSFSGSALRKRKTSGNYEKDGQSQAERTQCPEGGSEDNGDAEDRPTNLDDRTVGKRKKNSQKGGGKGKVGLVRLTLRKQPDLGTQNPSKDAADIASSGSKTKAMKRTFSKVDARREANVPTSAGGNVEGRNEARVGSIAERIARRGRDEKEGRQVETGVEKGGDGQEEESGVWKKRRTNRDEDDAPGYNKIDGVDCGERNVSPERHVLSNGMSKSKFWRFAKGTVENRRNQHGGVEQTEGNEEQQDTVQERQEYLPREDTDRIERTRFGSNGESVSIDRTLFGTPENPRRSDCARGTIPIPRSNSETGSDGLLDWDEGQSSTERLLRAMLKSQAEANRNIAQLTEAITSQTSGGGMGTNPDPGGKNGGGNRSARKGGLGTPKRRYEDIMKSRLPHLERAFNKELLCRCISTVYIDEAWKVVDGNMEIGVKELVRLVKIVMFSVGNGKSKAEFKTPEGVDAIRFRKRVLYTILYHARRDTYGAFRSTEGNEGKADSIVALKPFWLRDKGSHGPAYITTRHVDVVRDSVELEKGSGLMSTEYRRRSAIGKGATPDREDDAYFAIRMLYSSLLLQLNTARKLGTAEFMEMVGYLFINWDSVTGCTVADTQIVISFDGGEDEVGQVSDRNGIPDTIEYKGGGDSCTNAQAIHKENERKYEDFCTTCPEFMICVVHDVIMKRDGVARSGGERVRRRWKRLLNVMDVSLHVVKMLCGGSARDRDFTVLSYHPKCLHVLHAISKVFMDMIMVQVRTGEWESTGLNTFQRVPSQSGGRYSGRNPYTDEKDYEVLWNLLYPCDSYVKRSVLRSTMNVSKMRFDREHISEEGIDGVGGAEERNGEVDPECGDDDDIPLQEHCRDNFEILGSEDCDDGDEFEGLVR